MNRKGFTLIEMLVVVAIVGLLSSVVVIGLGGAREKARDARRISDIREIQNGLELNYASIDGYTDESDFEDLGVPLTDPQGVAYVYETGPGNATYYLGINLETGDHASSDPTACPGDVETGDPYFCVTP